MNNDGIAALYLFLDYSSIFNLDLAAKKRKKRKS